MSNITTLEQAKKMKNIGFNAEVHRYFLYERLISSDDYNYNGINEIHCSAPTVSEALDFIREKGIYCGVYPFMWGYKGMAIVQDRHNPCMIEVEPLGTHHLAESALLDAVLTYLESSKEKSFSES